MGVCFGNAIWHVPRERTGQQRAYDPAPLDTDDVPYHYPRPNGCGELFRGEPGLRQAPKCGIAVWEQVADAGTVPDERLLERQAETGLATGVAPCAEPC